MDDSQQFARIEALFGASGLARLQEARVMVVGLGGVGGACVEVLARGGIGGLTLVDCDAVEPSNINRQVIAYHDTIGMRKTDAARELVMRINPNIETTLIGERISEENIDAVMQRTGSIDFLVDACDDVPAKLALAVWAQAHGIPFVSCMGTARKLFPERLEFADIYETHDCPLCRAMRPRCRKAGLAHMTVLFSPETPYGEAGPVLGTTSFTPPIAGAMLAGHVVRALLGIDGS